MAGHTSSVYNNSCLKVPRHPVDKKPYPVQEQKFMNELENEVKKITSSDKLKSFLNFYDSIPEYDEVNHLSNKDFYRKLETLKRKQKSYFECLEDEWRWTERKTGWIEEYKNLGEMPECESRGSKPSSRRSVRIETPFETTSLSQNPDSFRTKSSASRKLISTESTDFSDVETTLTIKSAPSSPRKVGWKDCGVTIPKPFQMTVRDEENQIVEELMIKNQKTDDTKEEKHEHFKAHPVPIESQIPLFEKIMFDQERRRQLVKRRSKENLRAQMRPFSFTKRDEEIQAISKRLSKSSPNLYTGEDEKLKKVKQFKAKPVPKNLFSNYVYRRMHEDEFYRALQKKIRSEEMLKAASLPPAMEKREKTKPKYHICPRSYRDVGLDEEEKAELRSARNKNKYNDLDRELAELELDFILATPSPKPTKKKIKKKSRKGRKSTSGETTRSQSALESVNRSNLAAVLRIQSARKRMEDEISRKLESAKIREEARWREKVLRQKPVWQALAYSHEEDLNMRLQMRRDEERNRMDEHRERMHSMLGRVNRQPTLYERQSRNVKTREELITEKYFWKYANCENPRNLKSPEQIDRNVIEMKDEAVQAHFDEMFRSEEKIAIGETGNGVTTETEDEETEKKKIYLNP